MCLRGGDGGRERLEGSAENISYSSDVSMVHLAMTDIHTMHGDH